MSRECVGAAAVVEACLRIVAPSAVHAEVLEVMRSLKGPAETTAGCRDCRILVDSEDESLVTYVVRWDTAEELVEHFRSDRFRRLLPYIEMSLTPPELEIHGLDRLGGIELLLSALAAEGDREGCDS